MPTIFIPAYIHRGRKTERDYRVEHFATAFRHYLPEFPTRERASMRKETRSEREALKAHGCTVGEADQGQLWRLDSKRATAEEDPKISR
jgi:hypothetical protein